MASITDITQNATATASGVRSAFPNVFENLASITPSAIFAISTISFALGVAFVIGSLRMGARLGDRATMSQGDSKKAAGWLFATGMIMMALPFIIPNLSLLLWGSSSANNPEKIFELAPSTVGLLKEEQVARASIIAMVRITQAIGFFGFVMGVLFLKARAVGEVSGPAGPGWVRIVFGSAAINLPTVVGGVEKLFQVIT